MVKNSRKTTLETAQEYQEENVGGIIGVLVRTKVIAGAALGCLRAPFPHQRAVSYIRMLQYCVLQYLVVSVY